MFSESAELYDAIYGAFKDYAKESAEIVALLRVASPTVRTVLDVGCGTGEHVRHLRESHGLAVDGLDLDAGLLAVARSKVPAAQFFEGDMTTFALGRKYDAVMCMFSSIGYVRTLERVAAVLKCFRDHTNAGGVIVVEPWLPPGTLRLGAGDVKHGEAKGVRVARTSHVAVKGRLSTLTFDYEITDAAGTRHSREVHELGLFTPGEMLSSFEAAGLDVTLDPNGPMGRGLYTARVRA